MFLFPVVVVFLIFAIVMADRNPRTPKFLKLSLYILTVLVTIAALVYVYKVMTHPALS